MECDSAGKLEWPAMNLHLKPENDAALWWYEVAITSQNTAQNESIFFSDTLPLLSWNTAEIDPGIMSCILDQNEKKTIYM